MIGIVLVCFATTPDVLRAMPGVAQVTVRPADSPTHRVIHILDWHYVPERRFRIDTPDGDYDAFLDEVEALQNQQRALIKAMGMREVFLEGLTAESKPHFLRRVEVLKKYKPPAGDGPIDVFVRGLRREDELQLGAPGQMLVASELDDVLAADNAALHRAAAPAKDGSIDATANEARENGIAKLLLTRQLSVVAGRRARPGG